MVTHEPEVAVYTKRIITMRDGAIVSDAQVKERRRAEEDLAAWKAEHAYLAEGAAS
jgi:putative ABC transport system ATP-binding protein